jgi:hypothetical protein
MGLPFRPEAFLPLERGLRDSGGGGGGVKNFTDRQNFFSRPRTQISSATSQKASNRMHPPTVPAHEDTGEEGVGGGSKTTFLQIPRTLSHCLKKGCFFGSFLTLF